MRSLGSSGVWELFIPGVAAGARYKYELVAADDRLILKADPMAFATEVPPATASVVAHPPPLRVGRRRVAGPARPGATRTAGPCRSTRCTSARGATPATAMGGGRPLTYRELAEQLPDYVAELGFTHVEFMPVAEHPFAGSWGYQVSGYYAPTTRFGSPDDFRALVDAFHRAGDRRDRRLGAGPLSRRTSSPWPASTAPRCTSTRTRGRASTPTGARWCSTSGATRSATSSWPTPCTGSSSSTSTHSGSTPWPRCCTSTTPARRASGCRTSSAAGRTSRRSPSSRRSTSPSSPLPRGDDHRRGVHRLARRVAADLPRGARVRVQVEHGVDARHPRLLPARPDLPPVPPRRADLRADLRLERELHPPPVPRRGRPRQGVAAQQDARGPLAAAGQPAGPVRLDVGPPGQAAAVHGRRDWPRSGSGTTTGELDWWILEQWEDHRRLQRWWPSSIQRTGPSRPCGRRTRATRVSSGSTPATPSRACCRFCVGGSPAPVTPGPLPRPRVMPRTWWPASPT